MKAIETEVKDASAAGGWHVVIEVTGANPVDFTDKNGNVWGVAGGRLVAATSSKTFDEVTLTPHIYKTRTGDAAPYTYSDEAGENDLKALTGNPTYAFDIVASDRARITYSNPGDSSFTGAFGENFENTLKATVKVTTATGALSIKVTSADDNTYAASMSMYFSVSGQSNNVVQTAGADASVITDSYETDHIYGRITTQEAA